MRRSEFRCWFVGALDFVGFGFRKKSDCVGHREDFDEREEFGGEVAETLRVEAARADFGKEVGAQHLAAIDEIDRAGDMAGVAVLGLHGGELGGKFGAEYEREVFGGLVAHGLGDEVGECHMAAARSVMRVLTRVSRRARSRDSPML